MTIEYNIYFHKHKAHKDSKELKHSKTPPRYVNYNFPVEGHSSFRLVFSWFLDLCRYLRIVKEKPSRKTCFSSEQKYLIPCIYQAKFCLAAFLWNQKNLCCIFTRNRCWNRGEYLKRFIYKSFIKSFVKAL